MAGMDQVRKNLRVALKEALRIQNRFIAEPVFGRTGRGFMKSDGVQTLLKIKANLSARKSPKCNKSGSRNGPGKQS